MYFVVILAFIAYRSLSAKVTRNDILAGLISSLFIRDTVVLLSVSANVMIPC